MISAVLVLSFLAAGYASAAGGAKQAASSRPMTCTVKKLELVGTEKVMLSDVSLPIVQPDGKRVSVPVEATQARYHCEYQETGVRSTKNRTGDHFCYELRSLDNEKPFHWYLWSDLDLAKFRLWTTTAGRSYLTSSSGWIILVDEVSKSTDKATSFCDWAENTEPAAKSFFVPIADLRRGPVPVVTDTEISQFLGKIEVRSFDEGADGAYRISFSGGNPNAVYVAVSGPSGLGWGIKSWRRD